MAEINYKKKYFDLRTRYINDLDMAFRLGIEQGAQQEQINQANQQQQQQAELEMAQAQAAAGGGQPGEGGPPGAGGPEGAPKEGGEKPPGQESGQESGQMSSSSPDGAPAIGGGSELDQHISQLESMLGKPAGSPEEMQSNIKKALGEIKSLRKAQLQAIELKKSAAAIPAIAKALHRPAFKMSRLASQNLNDNAKKAVTMQEKIVGDIMKKWQEEETKAAKDIVNVLSVEGLTKKE